MGARSRRFIATIGVVLFLIFYVWAVVSIGAILPKSPWIDLLFYGGAGIAWGVPIIPLLRWAERGSKGG